MLVLAGRLFDHHVAGLDVAVNEPARVRCVEAGCDLAKEPERPLEGQRAATADDRLEVLAFDQAHRDEQPAACLARAIHGNDVGMVEFRSPLAPRARTARDRSARRRPRRSSSARRDGPRRSGALRRRLPCRLARSAARAGSRRRGARSAAGRQRGRASRRSQRVSDGTGGPPLPIPSARALRVWAA